MDKITDVASYIAKRYKQITGEDIEEAKLQNLLYFTQRESFAISGQAAFEGDLEGSKIGPASREVRNNFRSGEIIVPTQQISEKVQYIATNVIYEYGSLALWRLTELNHQETSWKNARKGLDVDENGTKILLLQDILEDAKKIRPYDHQWDMYYDEFDDLFMLPDEVVENHDR